MGRALNGWVKLWRKALNTDIGANFLLLGLWVTLLRWANFKESVINWRGEPRVLKRGQLLTTYEELATSGEVNRKTVMRWLAYLEKRQSILVEKAPPGSHYGMIITISNYEKYQSVKEPSTQDGGCEPGHEDGQEDGHGGTAYKELKNIRSKEGKKGNENSDKSEFLPRLAVLWNEYSKTLAKVKKTNKGRTQKANLRLREHGEEFWIEMIKRVADSKFCNGENDRGWRADFDWILQPDVALKISEFKYNPELMPKPELSSGAAWIHNFILHYELDPQLLNRCEEIFESFGSGEFFLQWEKDRRAEHERTKSKKSLVGFISDHILYRLSHARKVGA